MFRKSLIALAAAVVGAFVTLAVEPTPAFAKGAKPQTFKCKVRGKAWKESVASGTPYCNVGKSTFFNYGFSGTQFKASGRSSSSRSFLITCQSLLDIRTAEFPIVFRAGDANHAASCVYGESKGISATGGWGSDENDPESFVVTFKSYDPVAKRLSVTFKGNLPTGEDFPGAKNAKIKGGVIQADVNFNGL